MNTGYMYINDNYDPPVTFSYEFYENNDLPATQETAESIPQYHYSFNPDIYHQSTLALPRNILRIISNSRDMIAKDISVRYHMPHWKYSEYTPKQQREFVSTYFPDRLPLYKKLSKENRSRLFIYLWMYMNGGIYIGSNYELLKPLDTIFEQVPVADLYFVLNYNRYISEQFFAAQPFCEFWLEVINKLDRREALTEVADMTHHKYTIIPRTEIDPYEECDVEYNKDSYLRPINKHHDLLTYMSCQTGSSTDLLYLTGVSIIILLLMFIIALITN